MSFPFRVYHHHDMKEWLARLLSRKGLEDIMDSTLKRAAAAPPSTVSDVWDAPIFRDLYLKNGTRFVEPPDEEGRYIFGLAVDSFNPFSNKQAKQQASVTAIYLYCLNLPPHLRYLPENMYLVGIIPGPHKPSVDQINHFIQLLVDELLVFWDPGVFYSRTAKYPEGRLVRCALGPLVCDLPAARQVSGYGAHNARYFCSVCKLPRKDINEVTDPESWPPRSRDDHRSAATAWKESTTTRGRKNEFAKHSIRWSPLLDLPYWDPIQFTVIDSMHNHYLGLLKHHCRSIWGMDEAAGQGDDEESPSRPSPKEIAAGLQTLYTGTELQLARCKRAVLMHLCSLMQLHPGKGDKKHLLKELMIWVGP